MKDKPKYVCGSLTKDEIIHELNERNKLLAKALDKVCDLIEDYVDCPLNLYEKEYPFCKGWECDNHSARCWKEYLLKEVQKDEL